MNEFPLLLVKRDYCNVDKKMRRLVMSCHAHTLALPTYTTNGVTNVIRQFVLLICTKFAINVLKTKKMRINES